MQNTRDLSIIIVNYRSEKYLDKCLSSIYGVWGQDLEIIIVNNDTNESLQNVGNKFPSVKIIQQKENVGFGRAQNAGSQIAQGKYLLFLNPDTIILNDATDILNKFEQDDTVGIIGAKMVDSAGKNQVWSVGYEATLWNIVKNKLGFLKGRNIWEATQMQEVEWTSGGSMFIHKEVFAEVGGFDEKFFLYFEDMDLCKRVRALGKKVLYFPNIQIEHVEGGSVENKNKQKKDYYASQDYYFSKHFGVLQVGLLKLLRKLFV